MVSENLSRPVTGIFWMLVTGLCFITVTALVKFLGPRIPPAEAAFLRYLLGLVFLIPAVGALRSTRLTARQWTLCATRGGFHAFGVILWFYAMTRIPLADVTAMNYLAPIYVTVGAAIFLGERLAFRRIAAVVLALVGAVIILRPGFREVSSGHIAMIFTALVFGGSYLTAKILADEIKPSVVVAMLSIFVTIALAPFALILILSEGTRYVFGALPLYLNTPEFLSGVVEFGGGLFYPKYRLAIIVVGLLIAAGLFLLIAKTRLGIRIRAGESDREMIAALGVDISKLYTIVFALGAALAGLAGAMVGVLESVEVGMGEPVLILAFVVIVIGGIGSIKGALIGSLLVGITDTMGRVLLPPLFSQFMPPADAVPVASALASMSIYILMAIVLVMRPAGLFGGAK